MRRRRGPSELARMVAPLFAGLDAAWQRMHWWVAAMAVLYLVSGITVVRPDEVAVVLRWGRLVGATPALQEHGPGLLFALPKPIDEVVRVQTRKIREVPILTLAVLDSGGSPATGAWQTDALSRNPSPADDGDDEDEAAAEPPATLDPLTQGYALTGDQNIVQAVIEARYRVRDPGEWAFYGPKPENILRVEVTAAMVRTLGEMGVDSVLSDGRKTLIANATRRAQEGLDAAHSGLELTSLELTRLGPPAALAPAFDAVQSAFIQAQTDQDLAQAYANTAVPAAAAEAEAAEQAARAQADADLAAARGDAAAFRALETQYHANPSLVGEALYRDAIDKAISTAGAVRWVPPPTAGGKYQGFRISLPTIFGRAAPCDPDEQDCGGQP